MKSRNKGLRVLKTFQGSRGPSWVLTHANSPNPTVTSLFLFMFLSLRNRLSSHSLRLFTHPLRWWAPLSHFSFVLHTAQAHTFILISSLGDKSCCWRRGDTIFRKKGHCPIKRPEGTRGEATSMWPCHEWKYPSNPLITCQSAKSPLKRINKTSAISPISYQQRAWHVSVKQEKGYRTYWVKFQARLDEGVVL